jgi:hypothetical protein
MEVASSASAKAGACQCSEWRASTSFCADLRACRYVQTRLRVRRLQEMDERCFQLPFVFPSPASSASSAASAVSASAKASDSSASATASAKAPSASGDAKQSVGGVGSCELRVAQRPERLHSGGESDSTGSVAWGCGVLLIRWLAQLSVTHQRMQLPPSAASASASVSVSSSAATAATASAASLLQGRVVVELGCGTGLASVATAALTRPQTVWITDGAEV